jgi:hypothetical protein
MKRRSFAAGLTLVAGTACLFALAILNSGPPAAHGQPPEGVPPIRTILGDSTLVDGNFIVSWARVHRDHGVKEVGVTIPVAVFDEPQEGEGPAGAFASLKFPEIVLETTYFNHVELQWNPHGHDTAPGSVNPIRNSVPHFDFHFYAVAEEVVWEIPLVRPPSAALPIIPAERLPADYTQPGPSTAEMGRHSGPIWALSDPDFLSTIMIAGFPPDLEGLPDPIQMHFIEPMVSRERLLARSDFELPVPMPATFGRVMLYPKEFVAEYDADLDAYHFVFSEFEVVK